jgi:putative NADH-flavin reductase
MKLAVFGGSGRVGRLVVSQALARGHQVSALVREAGGLPANSGVRCVGGDVTDPSAVEDVVRGSDAVLSSLGAPSLERPGTVLQDGMRTITGVMRRLGVRRIVAVAGSGVLDDPAGGLRHDQPGFPATFRAISAQHAGTWAALKESRLDWTLVCTPTQVSGRQPERVRALVDQLPAGGAEIAVEDIAAFMVSQLGDTRFLARRIGLSW